MGNLCAGPKDLSRGLDKGGNEAMLVWGDHFSADTRTMIAILHYSGIDYSVETIETDAGELTEESGQKYSDMIHKNSNGLEKNSTVVATNGQKEKPKWNQQSKSYIITNQEQLFKYLAMARPEARDLMSRNEVENQTYSLWLQNILKPTSTRYV